MTGLKQTRKSQLQASGEGELGGGQTDCHLFSHFLLRRGKKRSSQLESACPCRCPGRQRAPPDRDWKTDGRVALTLTQQPCFFFVPLLHLLKSEEFLSSLKVDIHLDMVFATVVSLWGLHCGTIIYFDKATY